VVQYGQTMQDSERFMNDTLLPALPVAARRLS
jgi:hypothetical protein